MNTFRRKIQGVWVQMIRRCCNPLCKSYYLYGARGISVCHRWKESFENFFADMASSYKPGLLIDRTDTNGDYTPENCRWVTRTEQNNNTRRNRFYVIDGVKRSISQWAHLAGVNHNAMKWRLHHWPHEFILSPKLKNQHKPDGTFRSRCFTNTHHAEHVVSEK